MNAEILAIGTELLLGDIANTDAQDISQGMAELGIDVHYHSVVGDNPERIRQALELALSRADIVVTTGGLGPTYDDITKELCAAAFGLPLEMHEDSLRRLEAFFTGRGRTMTPNNRKQAMLPRGCTVFPNDWGTAPGCAMEKNGQHILMLPGPPRECRPMFRRCAMPYLQKLSGNAIHSDWIRIFGVGESALEARLLPYMEHASNPTAATYVRGYECLVRVTGKAETEEKAAELNAPVVRQLCEEMGESVYGVNVSSLEETVVRLLKDRGMTLATAESCTGGLVSKRITDVPGASAVFCGGVCSYDNSVKRNVLGVDAKDLELHGAVSEPVAARMAQGVRTLMGTDIGIGITGIAGPASDSSEKPVGLVYIGVDVKTPDGSRTFVKEFRFRGDRDRIRSASADNALNMVRTLPELQG